MENKRNPLPEWTSILPLLPLFLWLFAGSMVAMEGCDPQQGSSTNPVAVNQSAPGPGGQASEPPLPGAKTSLTRNFYVVFDDSGSMGEKYAKGTRMEAARIAGEKFAKNAPADANLALYLLNKGEVVPLGSTREVFIKNVRNVELNGGTPLGQSIHDGVNKLVHQRRMQLGYGEFNLVVITDGESSDDLNYGVNHAKQHKIPIYTIGLATGEHSLAKASVYFAEAKNPDQLVKAVLEVTTEASTPDEAEFKK